MPRLRHTSRDTHSQKYLRRQLPKYFTLFKKWMSASTYNLYDGLTVESWDVNRHTARCLSSVSVVSPCELVSGWGHYSLREILPFTSLLQKLYNYHQHHHHYHHHSATICITCKTAKVAWWSQWKVISVLSMRSARHPSDNHAPNPSAPPHYQQSHLFTCLFICSYYFYGRTQCV